MAAQQREGTSSCRLVITVLLLLLLILLIPAGQSAGAVEYPELPRGGSTPWKVLVVQVDSRELEIDEKNEDLGDMEWSKANYHALSAVLMHRYCSRHGYDYLLMRPTINATEVITDLRRGDSSFKDGGAGDAEPSDGRKVIGTIHLPLKQFRAVSWSKLSTLIYINIQIGSNYDLIWYVDSDIGVSDHHKSNRSLEAKYEEWNTGIAKAGEIGCPRPSKVPGAPCINWGISNVYSSPLLLFPNSPYGDDEPCAGVFLFRPSLASSMISEWWDVNIPEKNFGLMQEQDALWRLTSVAKMEQLQAGGGEVSLSTASLTRATSTLLQEYQFPPSAPQNDPKCTEGKKFLCAKDYCVEGKQWLCHIMTNNGEFRSEWFREMLMKQTMWAREGADGSKFTADHYRTALKHVKHSMTMEVDMYKAAKLIYKHREELLKNDITSLPATEQDLFPHGLRHVPEGRKKPARRERSRRSHFKR